MTLGITNDDGCSGGADHCWWSTYTAKEASGQCRRETPPLTDCLYLLHQCYTCCVVSTGCCSLSHNWAKNIEGHYKRKSVTIGKSELCSYFWLWIVILVHNAKHSTENGRVGNYADVLTDVFHCSVRSKCYKLCCEMLKDWRRFIQTIGNAVTSWENTASRPRSRFISMLMLWLPVNVKF